MALRPWAKFWAKLAAIAVLATTAAFPATAQEGVKVHALTLLDQPKYGSDFKHLDYVNPDAPKGGTINLSGYGAYDSFNGWIVKGTAAGLPGLYDTLTTSPEDDGLTEYGLLAESMEVAEDKSWIIYNLRPEARWHDGQPITADDVVWTFYTLITDGDPRFRYYYSDVEKAEKLGDHRVKFQFKVAGNRELPVIMGQLAVLPKHWWATRNFKDVLLEPPLGSGQYKLGKFDMGRSVIMERVPDYWGKDLPINIGTGNYQTVRVTYYQDQEVEFEAFKSGAIDIRPNENSARRWVTQYEFPAVKDGRVLKEKIHHDNPMSVQGYVFNIRKLVFQDRRVRKALVYAFDFEWLNKNLAFGEYVRKRSYFQNSEMEAKGLPSLEELEILNPLKDQIPPEVFTTEYNPPSTDGSGNARDNLAKASALLDEAGWKVENGKRVKDGKVFQIEVIDDDPGGERTILPFVQNLQKLGIDATVRVVDPAQYESRMEAFDFDMTVRAWGVSPSPGNEQREFWGSKAANSPGSNNVIGISDPAVDKIIDLIVQAPTRHDLIIRCKALDRVLQWNDYMVPMFSIAAFRVAYWNRFGMPDKRPDPLYGYGSSSWWIDPAKEAALAKKQSQASTAAPTDPNAAQPDQTAASTPPAAATQPAAAQPAATQPAATQPADRGQSPLIYLGVGLVAVIVAFVLGRRRGKSS